MIVEALSPYVEILVDGLHVAARGFCLGLGFWFAKFFLLGPLGSNQR
jgi:hypothetical protein